MARESGSFGEASGRPSSGPVERPVSEALDDLGIVVWEADPESFALHSVSRGAKKLLDWPIEHWLNPTTFWSSLVHAEDRLELEEAFRAASQGRGPELVEHRLRREDERTVWVRTRIQPVERSDDPRPSIIPGCSLDVTDRKEVEERLRAERELGRLLAENATDIISLHDLEGRFLYVSPAVREDLGYEPEALVGRSVYEIVSPEDEEAFRSAHEAALEKRRQPPFLFRMQRKDGATRWFETSARVTPPTESSPSRLVAVTRDVTERHSLERQLSQAQRMEAVGRLAGGVAHDFNNLLTVIRGHADLLLEQVDPSSAAWEDAIELRRAAIRGGDLTGQLLQFSRGQPRALEALDLNEIIREMQGMLNRVVGEASELVLDLAPDLGVVRGDPSQMEQVLMNLVVNARDAVEGRGRIVVATENVEVSGEDSPASFSLPPGSYAALSVTDDGRGMDARTLARVFEPFFSTKARGEGTGLGLSTVYGIVRQSGGRMLAESEPGKGTRMRVYLPRLRQAVTGSPAKTSSVGERGILVVEDDEQVLHFLRTILERHGYRALVASSGEEAEKLFKADPGGVDLLLTDVVLPGINGWTLAQRLHVQDPELRLLFISGYTDQELIQERILGEGWPFLQKPFNAESVARKVQAAFGE